LAHVEARENPAQLPKASRVRLECDATFSYSLKVKRIETISGTNVDGHPVRVDKPSKKAEFRFASVKHKRDPVRSDQFEKPQRSHALYSAIS